MMASYGIGKVVYGNAGAHRRIKSWFAPFTAFAVAMMLASVGPASAQNAQESELGPEIEAFITKMAREHEFDALELRKMFSGFEPNKTIIKAIGAPATSKPWSYFRKLYVTPSRVDGGVKFWNEHAEWLEKARIGRKFRRLATDELREHLGG